MSKSYRLSSGHSNVLGASIEPDGVNFAVWCRNARVMELLLFKDVNDSDPDVIVLDKPEYRSTYYWHVKVYGITHGQIYGWRVKEILRPETGMVFDPQKVLLDPYGKRILFPDNYNRTMARYVGSNVFFCAKNAVIDMSLYDWESDERPKHPLSTNVIYEMHVSGFTKDKSSGVTPKLRGTYAGMIEKIPYLKRLGVNAVELLPVFQFDIFDARPGKNNYWGYCPMGFFAIHGEYSSNKDIYGPIDEFRDLVKALHKAGIEVFLDVVYNHTSEGDAQGPIYCFKGFDNDAYYILNNQGQYMNYTGCGNTVNASHPMVKQLIKDSLHFWAHEMHIDGFRFDLACVLSRDSHGMPLSDPPTTLSIDADRELSDVKLIAEPWDAGGLYQVGSMAGSKWREWNGQFRDDVRLFLRGDNGMVHKFANRLMGSPDIYVNDSTDPQKSINFVSCHDGFTLWDLLSYNKKHNLANGEDNRDGNDVNFSSNYGVEGEADDKEINALRLRQAKNFMLINLVSKGTPMILMGDEVLRTQKGNNNAYCQDSDISWFNWNTTQAQKEMYEFTKKLLAYRTDRGAHKDDSYFATLHDAIKRNQVVWHGIKPYEPDWSNSSHSIGVTVFSDSNNTWYYMYVNAWWNGLHITIPSVPESTNAHWYRLVDTSLPAPDDIYGPNDKLCPIGHNYYIQPRSILVLIAKPK